jgi:hypothetical protein
VALFRLPENWKSLSSTALGGQLATIVEMAATVDVDAPAAEATEGTPAVESGVDQLEALADAKDAIEAELAEREENDAAAADRRQAALDRFAVKDDDTDEESDEESDDTDEGSAGDVEALADAAPAASAAAANQGATDEVPTSIEPPAATAEAANDGAVDASVDAVAPSQPTNPAGSAAEATARMAARRTANEVPGAGLDNVERRLRTTSQLGSADVPVGTPVDLDRMAELLADRLITRGDYTGGREKERAFRANWNFADGEVLTQSPEDNYPIFGRVQREYVDAQQALVASGGPCAPLQPSYEFFQCFAPQRPVEAFLPTVGAPRGGIRYIQPPNFTEAQAAIDTKDSTDLAVTPGAGWVDKNCSRVSCPGETELTVAAVSWCVTFDNLNFRVFPEQVRDFLERVQTMHTRAKEIYYLNRIDQLSTAAVDIAAATAPAYGAARSLYRELLTLAHNYRKRNNMNLTATLDMMLPDVVQEILAIDMTNDASVGMSVMAGPQGNLATTLAQKARINIGFYYYDSDEAGFPASEHNGTGTLWQDLPSVVRSYIWAPGSIVRLDAGSLDVGPIRDSQLVRTNDVELFAEQWVEVANVGCEVNSYDHTLCPSGAAPTGVTVLAC